MKYLGFLGLIAAVLPCMAQEQEGEKEVAMSNSSYTVPSCEQCAKPGGTTCDCGRVKKKAKQDQQQKQSRDQTPAKPARRSAAQKVVEGN